MRRLWLESSWSAQSVRPSAAAVAGGPHGPRSPPDRVPLRRRRLLLESGVFMGAAFEARRRRPRSHACADHPAPDRPGVCECTFRRGMLRGSEWRRRRDSCGRSSGGGGCFPLCAGGRPSGPRHVCAVGGPCFSNDGDSWPRSTRSRAGVARAPGLAVRGCAAGRRRRDCRRGVCVRHGLRWTLPVGGELTIRACTLACAAVPARSAQPPVLYRPDRCSGYCTWPRGQDAWATWPLAVLPRA